MSYLNGVPPLVFAALAAGCAAVGGSEGGSSSSGGAASGSSGGQSSSQTSSTSGASSSGGSSSGNACALLNNTAPDGHLSQNGCARVVRDAAECQAAREAQGLSGFWLRFSCRVTLTKGATAVQLQSDGQPDHLSNYFEDANACHETYLDAIQNPNHIQAQSYSFAIPLSPDTSQAVMPGGPVGFAVNGVPIFSNAAAPGDDIFMEVATFDRCGAHPAMRGDYHYHGEPYAISDDDGNLIGVLRDGYPVYGRQDADGSLPVTDSFGGHTSVTADSAQPVYHYHLHAQTSTASTSAGQVQWFLTAGTYRGTPGN